MRKIPFALILSLYAHILFAGEGDYAINKIQADLIKNANVIKRMEECRFEILGLGKSRYYHKYALTILNENGERFAGETLSYNKLREIKSFEGTLFDENGKKIKSLKKSDIRDLSGVDDISLMDDTRIKSHNFYHRQYPYTIEYETVEQYNYNLFFPNWSPYDGEKMAIMQSAITIVAPADFPIRYKAFNYQQEPVKATEKNMVTYRWEVTNKEAIELEYASPFFTEIAPVVYFAPAQFEVEKYKGDMSSWENLGKFIYSLNKGRDELPEEIKKKVHSLVDDVTDPYKKIEILYDYMQQNTRYISIQLGIGGWQTYDAKYVAGRKYGDCKALSNYMYSLLKEAGIKSNYTLIRNGQSAIDYLNDFPNSYFNHAILSVPLKNDTVWLECTSQSKPAGYIGGSNANRQVLLVDEEGGSTAFTPKYGLEENLQTRNVTAAIDDKGFLQATINTRYKAVQQDYLHGMIHALSRDKQLEFLKKNIDLPHYDIVDFKYTEVRQRLPVLEEKIELVATSYASVTGKRLFITPNIISRAYTKLKPDEKRKYPVYQQFEYHDIDTAVITIPEGYVVEAQPAPVFIESQFGNYSSNVEIQPGKIIYYRELKKFSGRFPSAEYNELVKFYDQIYKADRSLVVLVKKD
ncbi:MAG: DUF3857 domain-containing protein [Chitinophagaceae bacterium]|nr:DUF3857 domain-containing protein [Chitinophagaceae bacterium]MCW5929591.1 DUF3857 domain-containing protein [Chitinophagaceae bacterium]